MLPLALRAARLWPPNMSGMRPAFLGDVSHCRTAGFQSPCMIQKRLAIFGRRSGGRFETPGLPSRAIAHWFKLWSRMNASDFAKNLIMPASCPWLYGLPVSGRQTCRECGLAASTNARHNLPPAMRKKAEIGNQWSATTKEPSEKSIFSRSAD